MAKRILGKGSRSGFIWQHNSYLGHVAMARQNMKAIRFSLTATKQAKELATNIELRLQELGTLLLERDDSKLPPV